MESSSPKQAVTTLLHAMRDDRHAVQDELFEIVYDELSRIAQGQLRRERRGHTLSTTALVHEAYLKLVDQTDVDWQDRAHFYAISARAMRQVLVEHARKRNAQKRGGGQRPITLEERLLSADGRAETLLGLDDALTLLAKRDARQAKVVEYRFFGGLTMDEIGALLGVSARTIRRDWAKAKAWLTVHLRGPDDASEG